LVIPAGRGGPVPFFARLSGLRVQPPNDADLLELLYRYAPDETELREILVTNPAKLFGFEN
jgi:hypothetical protein